VIIECPKCNKQKEIKFSNGLHCEHCKADISVYKYKKTIFGATAALIIGAAGSGYSIEKYILANTNQPQHRYSLIDWTLRIKHFKNPI